MEEKQLPSGAMLRISLAPFKDAKHLYQVFLQELRSVSPEKDVNLSLMKDALCLLFSSESFDAAMKPCLQRCLYNNVKIDESLFEKEEAREDFMMLNVEVAYANLRPFMKHLALVSKAILEKLGASPK